MTTAIIRNLVLVSAGLVFAQFGMAGSVNLPFSITASSTILLPPPNPLDFTEPDSNSWQSPVSLDFTGGPAELVAGYFLPCLEVGAQNGSASASFGSVALTTTGVGQSSGYNVSCSGGLADFSTVNDIPFTFGVPQTFNLSLSASTVGGRFAGVSFASLDSFEVFDSAGDNITSQASYTLITPEPDTFLQMLGGILICCGATRRWITGSVLRTTSSAPSTATAGGQLRPHSFHRTSPENIENHRAQGTS